VALPNFTKKYKGISKEKNKWKLKNGHPKPKQSKGMQLQCAGYSSEIYSVAM